MEPKCEGAEVYSVANRITDSIGFPKQSRRGIGQPAIGEEREDDHQQRAKDLASLIFWC